MGSAPRIDKLDKNYLINGNFDFWQRATSGSYSGTGGPVAGYQWADRFRFSVQSTNNRANRSVNRSTDVPSLLESGFRSTYSMEYLQTSALTLVGTDYLIWCEQQVEGLFYRDLHGKDMTLSFWFKSTVAGDYPASFNNGNLTRSYVTMFTYNTANVWQKIYVTVPTDSGGTWSFDNNSGLRVGLCNDGTGTWDAPALNTWLTGQYFTSATGVQVQSQANITIRVAQMQLSEGSQQRETFSMAGRNYADELALCQRYFEKSFEVNTVPTNGPNATSFSTEAGLTTLGCVPWVASPGLYNPTVPFKVRKRAAPVMTQYGNNAGAWCYGGLGYVVMNTTRTFNGSTNPAFGSESGFSFQNNTSTSTLFGVMGHWVADAEL